MKQSEYCRAVDKLEFSDNLAACVRAKAERQPRFRLLPRVVIAAVLACFMITTAFGAVSFLRQRTAEVTPVGSDVVKLTNAKLMEFTVSEMTAGVDIHYMELKPKQRYSFRHGMLRNTALGYLHITDDYALEPMEMNSVELNLKKNDRVYTFEFDYLETENGIISNHRSIYRKDEKGEILLNASDGNGSQWPVYFHAESGTIRDALPDWSPADFSGRGCFGEPLMGGILVSTIVNEGEPNSRNVLYWIAPGAQEAKTIELPGRGMWYVEQNTVFYQNEAGQLYRMDEDFQFEMICEYETMDYLQDGLLTVCVGGKLGILDAYTGDLYVIDAIDTTREATADYHSLRYGAEGTIALTQTQWKHEPERRVLCSLGILDRQTAELKLLQIESEYDGYRHNWLDESRFAVVYESEIRQFLCVYEFDM